ncbi:MAG: hypothetical protein ACOYB1_18325 [Limnohabitans sp.]
MEKTTTRRKKDFGETTNGMKSTLRAAMTLGFRPFCPVTCNLPTRMPQQLFEKLCRVNQNSEDQNYCNQVCRGKKLPTDLQFVEPVTFSNEDNAMPTCKPGKCSLCGKEKNVVTIFNKKSCSTCSPVYSAARNTPELLIKALLEEQRQEWVDKHFFTEFQQSAAISDEIAELREELVAIKDRNIQFHTKLADVLGLSDAYDIDVIHDAVSYLRGQINEDQQTITALKTTLDHERSKNEEQAVPNRDTLILEIAFALLDGSVLGIDTNTLRALR